jgi:PKD repeat protein
MNIRMRFVLLAAVLMAFGLVGWAAQASDPLDGATVQVQDPGGQTRTYRLIAQAQPAPGTQPTSQPATQPAGLPAFSILTTGNGAPLVVHVRANIGPPPVGTRGSASVPPELAHLSRFEWDFGDPQTTHNTLAGFNSAHVYDRPGTYTITLRVTDPAGGTNTSSAQVRIAPPQARPTIYVSNAGHDGHPGLAPEQPIRSWDRAKQLAGQMKGDFNLLFARGQTFDVPGGMAIPGRDVTLGAYGEGDLPTLKWTGPRRGGNFISTANDAQDILIQHLRFDSIYDQDQEQNGVPDALSPRGQTITVRNCEFRNVGYAINSNGKPRGLLVMDNTAPLTTGVRGYFVWSSGSDHVYVGNTIANVTREHVVRVSGMERLAVVNNTFHNSGKSTIALQLAQFGYVGGNRCTGSIQSNGAVTGAIRIGPLASGEPNADSLNQRTRHIVVEQNESPEIGIEHGSAFVTIRRNVIRTKGKDAIQIDAFDTKWQRSVEDVLIESNTAISDGETGKFLFLGGSARRITVRRNLYVAPGLLPGGRQTAVLYINDDDLESFTAIEQNVWPSPRPTAYAQGGFHYLWPKWSASEGYRTPDEWAAFPQVKGDVYENTTLDDRNAPPANSQAARLRAGAIIVQP